MEPMAYGNYSVQVQGLLFLGMIVGIIVAEVFFSGRVSDWIVAFQAKRRGGIRIPEMRLWQGYPAAVISAVGLIVWGISIDRNWHFMVSSSDIYKVQSIRRC